MKKKSFIQLLASSLSLSQRVSAARLDDGSNLGLIVRRTPQAPTQDPAFTSQLAILSSAIQEYSSIAKALETFTPIPQSVYSSGKSAITITDDPRLESPTSRVSAATIQTSKSTVKIQSFSQSSASSSPATSTPLRQSSSSPRTSASTSLRFSSTTTVQVTATAKPVTRTLLTSSSSSSATSSSQSVFSSSSSITRSSSLTLSFSAKSSSKSTTRTVSVAQVPSHTSSSSSSSSGAASTGGASRGDGSVTPPSDSGSSLGSGQIAGISVGAVSAAVVGVAALAYFLRRRNRNTAGKDQVYPEEAFLYDPPITPPLGSSDRPPQIGPLMGTGSNEAGIFVTRGFGAERNARNLGASPETLHSNGSGANTAYTSPEIDDHAGLIPAAARRGVAPIHTAPNFSHPHPMQYDNYPYNGTPLATIPSASYLPLHNQTSSVDTIDTSVLTRPSTRGVNDAPMATSAAVSALSSSRPSPGGLAFAPGLSAHQAALQVAYARVKALETDPNFAISPIDTRRAEMTPLSPEAVDVAELEASRMRMF